MSDNEERIDESAANEESLEPVVSDERKAELWDYYQEFVRAHGAKSITDLVVQRDVYKKVADYGITNINDTGKLDYIQRMLRKLPS